MKYFQKAVIHILVQPTRDNKVIEVMEIRTLKIKSRIKGY